MLIHDGHKLQQPQHGNGAGNDEKGSIHPSLFCKRLGEGCLLYTSGSLKEVAVNNFYYYVTQMIETHGPQMTLLFMGLFLAFMTMLKLSLIHI